jgi:predicted transcriptional regulator
MSHGETKGERGTGTRSRAGAAPKLHDTVRLSADGLAKVLGDLEARILHAVWVLGEPATARHIHDQIVADHDVSPLTTITVLNRLVTKRVLKRKKADGLLHFSARLNEADFMAQVSRRVVEGILSFGPDAVATSFVDVLSEQDPDKLEALAQLVQERLRERKHQ